MLSRTSSPGCGAATPPPAFLMRAGFDARWAFRNVVYMPVGWTQSPDHPGVYVLSTNLRVLINAAG